MTTTATMLLVAYTRGRHIDGLSSESPHVSDDDDGGGNGDVDGDGDGDEFVYSLLSFSSPVSRTLLTRRLDSVSRFYLSQMQGTLIRHAMLSRYLKSAAGDT